MTSKSKKLLKVIDGLRAWNLAASVSGNSQKSGLDIKEILKSDHFQLGTIVKHGFPFQPSCMAFDPVQRILAIGTKNGCVELLGRPGVEFHLQHPNSAAVFQLIFLVNEGGLISICSDNVVHLWNIRQKPPGIVHSLQFKRDTLTCGYLAVSSSWLSVGSDQGNVHFVNVQQFTTSKYVINWNRAINVTQSQRPGSVVQLAEHPQDSNRLLIGYSSGLMVLWDLRAKAAEARFHYHGTLYSFAWHWEGKSFISAHNSGTIVTWTLNQPKRPQSVSRPHAAEEGTSDSPPSTFEPIRCIQWLPTKNGESIIIFAGGNRRDCLDAIIDGDEGESTTPSITIMRGKRLAVMQMDFSVITFSTLCNSPYFNEACDPYAIAVLLQQDLVLIDLLSPGYPSFENPYPMDIAVSPVTACHYVVDCPSDLVPAFYAVGSRGKRAAAASKTYNQESGGENQPSGTFTDSFSPRKWPIDGGEWGTNLCSYQELIITGHADGSVRFWDASGMNLTPLYKVRTMRYFDRAAMASASNVTSSFSRSGLGDIFPSPFTQSFSLTPEQIFANAIVEPFAIRHIRFCMESRTLLLAGQRHLCLLSFCRSESAFEIPVLDVYLHYEEDQGLEPFVGAGDETSSSMSSSSGRRPNQQVFTNSISNLNSPVALSGEKETKVTVIVRSSVRQWPPGYQPSLICRLAAPNLVSSNELGDAPYSFNFSPISAIALTSATNLLAFATDGGIAVVDYYQGVCIVCAAVPEIEAMDQLKSSGSRSSSRFPNSGNGTKPNQPINVASPTASATNQPSPPIIRIQVDKSLKSAPPAVRHRFFRLPWKRRATDGNLKKTEMRLSENRRTTVTSTVHNHHSPNKIVHLNHQRKVRHTKRESAVQIQGQGLTSFEIIDFRGTDHTKPKIFPEASSDAIMASCPLMASMLPDRLDIKKGELNPLNSPLSDKYGDSGSQRYSDTSEQSSLDQSILESIRALAFVDMSDQMNEPSLWIGTNRGSVFGFSLNTSDESGTRGPHYNLLGSLFKFDGEVVFIGFGNAQGEICVPPSAKWEAGSSAAPRLTLVPNLNESNALAEHDPYYSGSSSTAMKRLGGPSPSSPALSRRGVGKRIAHRTSGSSLTLSHSGSPGTGGTTNSQEEVLSGSGGCQSSQDFADRYFMVVISEKHAQVIGFPSRNCYNRVKITETSAVIRAEIGTQRMPLSMVQTSPPASLIYVNCLLSNGHLVAFSLPSLRILSDVDTIDGGSFQLNLFTFGNLGHAIYFSSPSELAKITISADLSNNLSEMHGELFLPCNMPEPPKKNFFTNLFIGSGLSPTEKDALFGEQQAGKSTSGTAALLPSGRMERLGGQTSGATSEVARARNAAIERGEKLGQLDTQVQEMMDQSKNLNKTAAMLAAKYEKQDKWWGVWPR